MTYCENCQTEVISHSFRGNKSDDPPYSEWVEICDMCGQEIPYTEGKKWL
jgi:hypothetical protein